MAIKGWFKQLETPMSISATTRDFTEHTLISLDDPKTPLSVIEADPRYPSRFAKHPARQEFWCVDSSVDQPIEIPNVRKLTAKWSDTIPNALIRNGKPVFDLDPIKRPLRVSLEYYTMPKTIRMAYEKSQAYDPKKGPPVPEIPVTTTAGESLFLQVEQEFAVFQCEKNIRQLPLFMSKNRMFTNSDTVKFQGAVFEPLMLLLCGLTLSEAMFANGSAYYCSRFRLMVASDADGWCEKRRNAGFNEKVVTVEHFPIGDLITSHLKAILVGKPENPHYTSSPVLLTPEGRAFRAPGEKQASSTPQSERTGPVLSVEGSSGAAYGITDEDFQAAELKFYPRMAIPFSKYVPLI